MAAAAERNRRIVAQCVADADRPELAEDFLAAKYAKPELTVDEVSRKVAEDIAYAATYASDRPKFIPSIGVRQPPPPPGHYATASGMQPWDVIDSFGLDYYTGNVLKYLLRAGKKGPRMPDLVKARNYLDKVIADEADR
jgi:hypothetical protein